MDGEMKPAGTPSAGKDLGEFALKMPCPKWPGAGPAVYALYLQFDFEQFPLGTSFLVDPDQAVESGEWAVVYLLSGQSCIRIVQHGPAERLRLVPTGPCAQEEVYAHRSELRALHKVLAILFPDREMPGRGRGRNAQPSSGRQSGP